MWKYYTAPDRRDALVTIAVMVTVVIVSLGAVVPLLAAWAATRSIPALTGLVTFWTTWSPHAAFGPSTHGWLFWPVLFVSWAALATGSRWALPWLWWSFMPTGTGFATRGDVNSEMSGAHVRKVGRITRPDLKPKQLAQVDFGEVGFPVARTLWHQQLWLAQENALGVFAPAQSGKTLMVLIHQILTAPGFMLNATTKPELLLLTGTQRLKKGPVVVYDLTGAAPWPYRVKWSPTDGCTTVQAASRRAEALMAANSGTRAGQAGGGGNHAFFQRQGSDVLATLLLAAAIANVPLPTFVEWCLSDKSQEPVQILAAHPQFESQRRTLVAAQQLVPETYVGVWQSLRDGVACLADHTVVASCIPDPGEEPFDVAQMIDQNGSVYVVGSETDAARLAPLITAFVQHVLDAGRRKALTEPTERLAPPAVAVLDELPSICPLPDLPVTMADTAGRGFPIVWAAQSQSQLVTRWGNDGATSLLDNTTAVLVMGGLKSESTLKWASTMCGYRHDERVSTTTQSRLGATSVGTSLERTPVLEPGQVRMIRRGRALLVMRHLPPMIVALQPAWKRDDWDQLTADRDAARQLRTTTPISLKTATPTGDPEPTMPQPTIQEPSR